MDRLTGLLSATDRTPQTNVLNELPMTRVPIDFRHWKTLAKLFEIKLKPSSKQGGRDPVLMLLWSNVNETFAWLTRKISVGTELILLAIGPLRLSLVLQQLPVGSGFGL